MLSWMRVKFGGVIVGGIIGLIAFVFVFLGVFSPTDQMGGATSAGSVNGENISASEFSRELNRRMDFFKNMGGGTLTEAQMKQFRIKEGVFNELVNRKVLLQEAQRTGVLPSDEEVREKIKEIPAFQSDGRFDTLTYKQVLSANNHTPSSFERLIREDLMLQGWTKHFRGRARVSEQEIKDEFMISRDKRNIKFVVLNTETGKKGVQVSDEDAKKFLAEEAKSNLAKAQFEARKDRDFKGKTFDAVKTQLAKEILAGDKADEIRKVNEELIKKVAAVLKADKGSDAQVNALLKPYGAEVRSTGLAPRQSKFIPGAGDVPELFADAFAKKSPIDPAQGGKAKTYSSATWWVAAVVSESQKPDLSKFEAEREQLLTQLVSRKERELFDAWLKQLTAKAKIKRNDDLVGDKA